MALEAFQIIFEELGEKRITNLAAITSASVNVFFEKEKK